MTLEERRYDAAKAAMIGLLADHKDHEDERKHIVVKETLGRKIGDRVDYPISGITECETCAQAVARLAVEHADALLHALPKLRYHP